MNPSDTILSTQIDALLALTDAWAKERCVKIFDETDIKVKEIVRSAHRDARERLRRHVEQDRQSAKQRMSSFEATLKTRQRKEQQVRDQQFLRESWHQLIAELIDRWNSPLSREHWTGSIWSHAKKHLPMSVWLVEYPSDWSAEERESLGEQIEDFTGSRPEWCADIGITVGFRIVSAGACVDGTLQGLLANRRRLEAETLSAYKKLCNENGVNCDE